MSARHDIMTHANVQSYHLEEGVRVVGLHVREGVVHVAVMRLVGHHALERVHPLRVVRQLNKTQDDK